ncbi:LLM class flavin-dependent oxidoreductase [Amycolatopsis acidicola]|uniref:LLM class flavin-dependent oxidoreductase n=1 Tax=Amycolatopsis acidicola TaxID=2596893 RepID=UPI001FB79768|nr:LLM class flavin-dependent oxidoreductase [Amycolatopsis acidicola]
MSLEFLWYIPNQAEPGHRGDAVAADHNGLETLTRQAKALEHHGWDGALIGTGWGRPDTFTVATALAARTTKFQPLGAPGSSCGSCGNCGPRRTSPTAASTSP